MHFIVCAVIYKDLKYQMEVKALYLPVPASGDTPSFSQKQDPLLEIDTSCESTVKKGINK